MRLSLFSDYSLRVLIFGAVKASPFPLHEVADAYNISRHHLVKVVNNLTKHGYLTTRRGRGGGIELAMRPEDVRIGRLMRITETSTPMVECFDAVSNTCPIHCHCGMRGALTQAVGAFYDALDCYTLVDMIKGNEAGLKQTLIVSKNERMSMRRYAFLGYDSTSMIKSPLSPTVNGRLVEDITT